MQPPGSEYSTRIAGLSPRLSRARRWTTAVFGAVSIVCIVASTASAIYLTEYNRLLLVQRAAITVFGNCERLGVYAPKFLQHRHLVTDAMRSTWADTAVENAAHMQEHAELVDAFSFDLLKLCEQADRTIKNIQPGHDALVHTLHRFTLLNSPASSSSSSSPSLTSTMTEPKPASEAEIEERLEARRRFRQLFEWALTWAAPIFITGCVAAIVLSCSCVRPILEYRRLKLEMASLADSLSVAKAYDRHAQHSRSWSNGDASIGDLIAAAAAQTKRVAEGAGEGDEHKGFTLAGGAKNI